MAGVMKTVKLLTVEETRLKSQEGMQIIDIRPPFDFAGGHIPGALNFPGESFKARADQLKTDRPILLVSSDGKQSAGVCEVAFSMSFQDVSNLEGGFAAWEKEGYPIETISESLFSKF